MAFHSCFCGNKKYFALFEDRTEILTELLFREQRNYLIVEILLANAQRSGIEVLLLVRWEIGGVLECDLLEGRRVVPRA